MKVSGPRLREHGLAACRVQIYSANAHINPDLDECRSQGKQMAYYFQIHEVRYINWRSLPPGSFLRQIRQLPEPLDAFCVTGPGGATCSSYSFTASAMKAWAGVAANFPTHKLICWSCQTAGPRAAASGWQHPYLSSLGPDANWRACTARWPKACFGQCAGPCLHM